MMKSVKSAAVPVVLSAAAAAVIDGDPFFYFFVVVIFFCRMNIWYSMHIYMHAYHRSMYTVCIYV